MLNATSILASAPYCDHSNILLQHAVTHFQFTLSPSAPHVCSCTWAWGLGDACLLLQRSWPHWQRHCGWTWTLHRSSSTEEQRCVRVEVTHCQCKVLQHPQSHSLRTDTTVPRLWLRSKGSDMGQTKTTASACTHDYNVYNRHVCIRRSITIHWTAKRYT